MRTGVLTLLVSVVTTIFGATNGEAGCFGKRVCCQQTQAVCPTVQACPAPAPVGQLVPLANANGQVANPMPPIAAPSSSSADAGSGIIVTEERTQNYTVMREVREVRPDGSIIVRQVPELRTRTYTVQRELTNLQVIERKVDKLLDHYQIQFP